MQLRNFQHFEHLWALIFGMGLSKKRWTFERCSPGSRTYPGLPSLLHPSQPFPSPPLPSMPLLSLPLTSLSLSSLPFPSLSLSSLSLSSLSLPSLSLSSLPLTYLFPFCPFPIYPFPTCSFPLGLIPPSPFPSCSFTTCTLPSLPLPSMSVPLSPFPVLAPSLFSLFLPPKLWNSYLFPPLPRGSCIRPKYLPLGDIHPVNLLGGTIKIINFLLVSNEPRHECGL